MPSKVETEKWKRQLVENAEKEILKLTDSEKFKIYLDTVAKFHRYSQRNTDLIYLSSGERRGKSPNQVIYHLGL